MKYILIIGAAALIGTGCKTTKYIDREVIKVDSSLIEQNEGLQKLYAETVETYERQKDEYLKTGILFDTVYRDTGGVRIINKVTFDNGKIKTVEGKIIAVNQQLHEKTAELLDAHATIDDLSIELEKKEAQLSKKQTTVTKTITKTRFPFWLILLVFAGGFLLRHFWPRIYKLITYHVKP